MTPFQKAVIRMPSDVHVNVPLTNVAIAYFQNAANFIADRVFPNIPVTKQSDIFHRYNREDWNRAKFKMRAPATESAGVGFGTTRDQYFADVWALHHDISDQTRANADSIFNLDRDATNFLMMNGLLTREISFAAKFMVPGVWEHELDGIAANPVAGASFLIWSDAGSTPIEDVRAAKRAIRETTGFTPNKLTLGGAVYDTLVDHPDIVDRVKYGQTPGRPAMVNRQALAALFEVDEILVAEAIVNTAGEGEEESTSTIIGDSALLTFSPPAASLMMPSAGYTFSWNGYMGASDQGVRVSKFRLEHLKSDRVEAEMAYDQKLIAADLGFLFTNAVTVA